MPTFTDRFPHSLVNTRDISRRQEIVDTPFGLHKPLFISFAPRGPLNVPTKGSTTLLQELYGDEIFDVQSKFFMPPSIYAKGALGNQEILFVRVGDEENMAAASMVIEASVRDADLIQYEKGPEGERLLDTEGAPVPIMDGPDPLTEPGISITWSMRELAANETITNLTTTSVDDNGVTVTTYPIIAFKASDVGAAANNFGFRMYYTTDTNQGVFDNIGAVTYRFEPVQLNPNQNLATAIQGISGTPYLDVSLKTDALDSTTRMYYDLSEQVDNEFMVSDGGVQRSLFPMELNVYSDHVETIGNRVLALSSELTDESVVAHQVNILSGDDFNGNPYDHLTVTNDGTYFHSNRVNYFTGGDDGEVTWDKLQDLSELWFDGTLFPEMLDEARYPFNFVWDPGYRYETKLKMLELMGLRGDVRPMLTTQDWDNPANTAAQHISMGISLRAAAALYPESTYFGTPVARADIYSMVGALSSEPLLKKMVPCNYDVMIKMCRHEGGSVGRINGSPTGLPSSALESFSEVPWAPSTDEQKRRMWQSGINYAQYYDRTALHWPDYRTVYQYDNSILSSSLFVNKLVYTKQRCRVEWATHAGSDLPDSKINQMIRDNLEQWIYDTFDGRVEAEVSVFKTNADNALGYRKTISVTLRGNIPDRVYHFEIPVDRIEE